MPLPRNPPGTHYYRMPKPYPKSCQLRKGRRSLQNQIYHLTTATKDRHPFFAGFHTGRHVVRALQLETERSGVKTLAFVVMPDHMHWLLQLTADNSLKMTMNNVKANSARSINDFLGRSGSVWQKGYYDHALRSDEDVVVAARYVIANPVRAGIVKCVGQYALWDAVWL